MSVVTRPVPAPDAAPVDARPRPGRRDDAIVIGLLALLVAVVAAVTWRKWGSPEIDAGAELTTADLVAHGAVPYLDVRYFYGPLGLYGLAGAFKLFGTSYTVAFAFGFAQTIAILGAFYALGRQWLSAWVAGAATAIMVAIAFSGTAFDFVLPHTNSATMGILFLLLSLLAMARGRLVWAGVAAGLVGLTRPEFAAIEAGVVLAYGVGVWRERGLRSAARAVVPIAVPALAVSGVVLGAFAAKVGASRLFTENLWPVDFMRAAGFKSQAYWMPFDLDSFAGLAGRGLVYAAPLAALVFGVSRWRSGDRRTAFVPLAVVVAGLVAIDGALRVAGLFPDTRAEIQREATHLLIGMSALPALTFAVGAWALVRLWRRQSSPLGGSWPVDLALVAAAAALGLRAYNAFTPEGSYAPYYAAPLVLVLAIAQQRLARRAPGLAVVALCAVAFGLLAYSVRGIYGDESAPVKTARGTFVAEPRAAATLTDVVAAIRQDRGPLLAAPSEGGLYFMADRRPALYELMLLPGLLATPADEQRAAARLRSEGVRTVVIAARDYGAYGASTFGVDFDRTLARSIQAATHTRTVIGSLDDPAGGTYPSRGFTVLRLDG